MTDPYSRSSSLPNSVIGAMRTNVLLPNGHKILIPISEQCTVENLKEKAIVRGLSMFNNFAFTGESSALKLGGPDPALLWKHDLILDIVSDPENQTFILIPTVDSRQSSNLEPPQNHFDCDESAYSHCDMGVNDDFYIRLISPETALSASETLASMPIELNAFSHARTINDLQTIAYDKILAPRVASGQLPADVSAVVFSQHCRLPTSKDRDMTLAELGLNKIDQSALYLFVIPCRTSGLTIKDALGFKTSDRGLATFTTSLDIFIAKIAKDRRRLENLLEVLWEATHFPPAAISLKQICDQGKTPLTCAIFAACFRAICERIAPAKLRISQDNLLELSRQAFSWLCSQRSRASLKLGNPRPIVHNVEIRKLGASSEADKVGSAKNDKVVDMKLWGHAEQYLVSKERQDNVSSKMLAACLGQGDDTMKTHYFRLPSSSDRFDFELHKRQASLDKLVFETLLQQTNEDDIFKMVGPFQLSQCPGFSLPVVTLDFKGYVSTYNQRNFACDDRYSFTSNVIEGETKMPASEPGQFLLQKLQPIINERKKSGTWEVDSWDEKEQKGIDTPPDEAVVICVDTSGSMGASMPATWFENQSVEGTDSKDNLSRLDEVKELFRNTVIRLNAFRLNTHLGLVTFSSKSKVYIKQPLTQVLLNFKDALDNLKPHDMTAIWDAIDKATTMLIDYKAKHPKVKLRVVVLTDGINNDSSKLPGDVCQKLCNNDIVLDAIIIDTDKTSDLFKMAKHSGGYAFHPQSRMALFQIFLLENFIDINMRPDIVKLPVTDFASSLPKSADLKDIFDLPPRRAHGNENDHFIALADARYFLRKLHSRSSKSTGSVSRSSTVINGSVASGTTRLCLDQVQDMIKNPHPFMDVYVSETNMGFWKVVMEGPPDSLYETGTYVLSIEIGDDFPRRPPSVRFLTPILHPNVSKHGRICHPIFDREWNPSLNLSQVFLHIWGILMHFESKDAVDPIAAVRFFTDHESAKRTIKQYIDRFALKTRQEHRVEICGAESTISSDTSSIRSFGGSSVTSNGGFSIISNTQNQTSSQSLTAANLAAFQRAIPPVRRSHRSIDPALQPQTSANVASSFTTDSTEVRRPDPRPVTPASSAPTLRVSRRAHFFSKFHRS